MRAWKWVLVCVIGATLCGQAVGAWIPIEKPYELFGHLWNTTDGSGSTAYQNWCVPTATMNSFIYLENKYPSIYDNLLTPGTDLEAREALRIMMGGCAAGATDQQWWEGKVNYLEEYAPGLTVYAGMVATTEPVAEWLKGSCLTIGAPTWEFLWTELAACEDVEIKIWDGTSDLAHALTLTSLKYDDREDDGNDTWDPAVEAAKIDYLDPNNPTQLFEANLTYNTSTGYLQFVWVNGGKNNTEGKLYYITAAFSESPIPEPAAIVIWSLLAGLGLVAGWRRSRTA